MTIMGAFGRLCRAIASGAFAASYSNDHRSWQLFAAVTFGLLTLVDFEGGRS